MRRWMLLPFALIVGTIIGYLDLQLTNVQIPPIMLFVMSFGLSVFEPRWWMAFCALLVVGVPIAHVIASNIDYAPPLSVSVVATFLAFIPTLIGSFGGGWMGRKARKMKGER